MTTPETQEVSQGITEDQAASEMLKRWGADEPESKPEKKDEPGDDDQPNEEAEQPEGDADADTEDDQEDSQSEEVEIDVAGEKFKLPAALTESAKRIEAKVKEIEAGTTRKFQEAAEIRKSAESQLQSAQQLQKIAVEQSDLIADHKMVMRRLAQLENIDVNSLAESDPVQLTRINAEYNQLSAAKQRIEQTYQQKVAEGRHQTEQVTQTRMKSLQEFAQKNIKGWSDDYSNKLLDFSVKQLGFDAEQLRGNMNEAVLKGLDLAYRGWKVQNSDPKAKQVVGGKTLRPGGAGQSKPSAVTAADQAMKRLKTSGRPEDAAMALLARSNIKKR